MLCSTYVLSENGRNIVGQQDRTSEERKRRSEGKSLPASQNTPSFGTPTRKKRGEVEYTPTFSLRGIVDERC